MILRKEVFFLVFLLNAVVIFARILKPSELKPKYIVETTSGLIQGKRAGFTLGKNRTIYRFRGIPYAEPPIEDLRFEPAIPKIPWNGVLDASERAPMCTQGLEVVVGSEDCLYVKIYSTKMPKRRWRMPVLVWLYGGGFYEGNPDFDKHSPKHLLDEDLMVVSFNYRVGIFGFLSTNDSVSPGNLGIKDQLFALRWIKDNIENFGGDPNRITLIGQSAGAASIGYLIASRHVKGLINGAIMLSGNPLNQWTLARDAVNFGKAVAQQLGVDISNSRTMVDGLKALPREALQKVSQSAFQMSLVRNPLHGLPIAPVIEPPHPDAIYTGNYHDLLENGNFADVPIMMGHTSLEAGPNEISPAISYLLPQLDVMPQLLVPVSMNLHTEFDTVGNEIKVEYFGNRPIATSHYQFKQFLSDDQFVRGIWEAVRLYSQRVPVFYYQFSYEGILSGETNRTYPGAGHTEDLSYLFETGHTGTQQDYLVRKRFIRMVSNFAAIFNPTPSDDPLLQHIYWKPNTENTVEMYQMNINADLRMVTNPFPTVMSFWTRLFEEKGHPPYSTF